MSTSGSSLSALLTSLTDKKVVNRLSKSNQADPSQVTQLINLGIPTLVQAMKNNASTASGSRSLGKALDQHAADPVNDLSSFLKQLDPQDGSKIIGHILGSNSAKVQTKLGAQTGLQSDQVGNLLNTLGPILMGTLAQQKNAAQSSDLDLSALLGGLLGGSGNNMAEMAMGLLDTDHDGDVMDDVGKLLGGFLNKR